MFPMSIRDYHLHIANERQRDADSWSNAGFHHMAALMMKYKQEALDIANQN